MTRDYGEFNPVIVYSHRMEDICPYNDCVSCDEQSKSKCGRCGWNPDNKELINDRLWSAVEAHEKWLAQG